MPRTDQRSPHRSRALCRFIRGAMVLCLLALALGCGSSGRDSTDGEGSLPPLPTPNVVLIMCDDMGYGDLGCFGSQSIATPRIDAMAADGTRLTSFYTQSICTPTRASLMTGRYAPRVRMSRALGPWSPVGLAPSETTLAEVARSGGYRSGLFGKWHLGDSPDQLPTAQGFDSFVGLPWGPTGIPVIEIDSGLGTTTYAPDPLTQTRRATTRALEFIDTSIAADPDGRFFCWVSYVAPHEPAAASAPFQGQSIGARDYDDAVEEVDFEVGRILDHLSAAGIDDNTLIIFMSDNGAAVVGEPYQNGSNGPLSGGKGSTAEGGVRVPAIARWPGTIPAATTLDEPLHIVDLLPTLASLAGVSGPSEVSLDGADISHLLSGDRETLPERDLFFSELGTFDAVRRGPYKLRQGELFDLDADIGETTDISAALPGLAAELQVALDEINADANVNFTPQAESMRTRRVWRADVAVDTGQGQLLSDGASWSAQAPTDERLFVQDSDPALDLQVVPTSAERPGNLPTMAVSLPSASADVRLSRTDAALDGTAPFSIELWYQRATTEGAAEPLALLDVGDAASGLSFTIGDAGLVGDDGAPGRFDDLRVRIGGQLAGAASRTLEADLPGGQPSGQPSSQPGGQQDGRSEGESEPWAHIVLSRTDAGATTLTIDGIVRASVSQSGAVASDWSPSSDWSLFAPTGALGGSGGPGVLPFEASRSAGSIAGFGVFARGIRSNETSVRLCRYAQIDYCFARANSSGAPATLSAHGNFDLVDEQLTLQVSDAPPGAFGFMLASLNQARVDVGSGTVCLAAPISRLDSVIVPIGLDGRAEFEGSVLDSIDDFDRASPPGLNLQFWFRDTSNAGESTSNTTNAMQVFFCRG